MTTTTPEAYHISPCLHDQETVEHGGGALPVK